MEAGVNLDCGVLCRKKIKTASKFADSADRKCHRLKHHDGKCVELPFLQHLELKNKPVAKKIKRDAMMTTGAAWKSEEAGPNRILRWVMLESNEKLKKYGIDMKKLRPQVVGKLREKAADYDSCIQVAMWLTFIAYQMDGAPVPTEDIREYLESLFGEMRPGSTTCTVCLLPLSFKLFAEARRGKAPVESCHKDPRKHLPGNVGFAHRECNIAQGPKTLSEFYRWIEEILRRVKAGR